MDMDAGETTWSSEEATDRALRDRLAGLDPQRHGVPTLEPTSLEAAMKTIISTDVQGESPDGATERDATRRRGAGWGRRGAALLVAAAGIAGALTVGNALRDGDGVTGATGTRTSATGAATPGAADPGSSTPPAGSGTGVTPPGSGVVAAPLLLALPTEAAARCKAPSVETLASADRAFLATVESVDSEVLFRIDKWFKGDKGEVTATLPTPSAQDAARLVVPDLTVGTSYLVATFDGRIGLCGLTEPVTPDLQRLYEGAFR